MKTEEKGIVQERREVVMEDQGRVLIVDDEEIFLMSTADLLRREGYAVDSVLDAREAAQKLSENRYDVLISDIRMPWNPDLKLIQEIPEPNTGLPVILVTGYPSAPTAIQAISLSVLAYFVKPLEFYELLATVRKGVALRKTKDLVAESSLRVQGWADEMSKLASVLGASHSISSGLSAHHVMRAMLGRLGEVILDLKRLADLLARQEADPKACTVQHCPRLEMYERVINEGIETLERTKGAFKSKDLGELREKLEQMIERS